MSFEERKARRLFWGWLVPIGAVVLVVGGALLVVRLSARAKYHETSAHAIDLAQLALDRGDLRTARERFEEALDRDSESRPAAIALARLKLVDGDLTGSMEDLAALAERFPEDFDTQLLLASVGLHLGEVARALPAARTAVAQREDSVAARLLLGRALMRSDAPEEAAEHFREALALDQSLVLPCFELARASRTAALRVAGWKGTPPDHTLRKGIERARKWLGKAKAEAQARRLIVRFLSAMSSRSAAEIVPEVRLMLERAADDPLSHLVAIRALWSVGLWEQAAEVFENAEGFFQEDVRFPLLRATFTGSMGYTRASREILDRAISEFEGTGRTGPLRLARAGLAFSEGDLRDAHEDFAAAKAEGAPAALTGTARLLARVEDLMLRWEAGAPPPPDAAETTERIEELFRKNPRDRNVLRLAGRAWLAAGRVRDAAEALLAVTARGTRDRNDLYYLGLSKLTLGEAKHAEHIMSAAIQGVPVPLHRLLKIAGARLAAGDASGARVMLDGLGRRDSEPAEMLLLRARIAETEGEDPLPWLAEAYAKSKAAPVALCIALLRASREEADADRILMDLLRERRDPGTRLALARYQFRTGAEEEALATLAKARNSPEAHMERVEYLLALGRTVEARKWLRSIPGPRSGRFLYHEGRLLLAEGKPEEAIAVLDSSLDRAGPRDAAAMALARALLATGDYERASELARGLLGKAPWSGPAKEVLVESAISMAARRLFDGDGDEAKRLLGEAAQASRSPLADLMLAEVLLRTGDPEAAEERLVTAREKDSQSALDHARLAAFRLAIGNGEGALESAAAARGLGPADWKLKRIEGLAHLGCGRPDEALEALRAVTAERPRELSARAGIVSALLALERVEEAEAAAGEACGAAPASAGLRILHGDVLMRLERHEDAAASWKLALDTDPSSVPAAFRLVSDALRRKRPDDALALLTRLAGENGSSARHWILLSRLQEHLAKSEAAAVSLHRAVAAEPESVEPVALLADGLLRRGDLRALDILRSAVDAHPDHPGLLTMLGIAHEQRREPVPAAAAYERALALRPGLVLAANNLALLLASDSATRERAEELARTAVTKSGGAPFTEHTLGTVLRAADRVEGALPHFGIAAEKSPKSATYAFDHGRALLETGDRRAGRKELLRSLRMGLDEQTEAEATRLMK